MNRMNILFTVIVEAAKKHGIAFLVMLGLVLYFHKENERKEGTGTDDGGNGDGTEFYGTTSTASRTIFARVLKGSGTLDFPDTASGASSSLTITVTGAAATDSGVSVQRDNASISGTSYEWVITGANTVTVYFHNFSGSNQDPASGTFRATVTK